MDIWFSRYDDTCFHIHDNICNMNNTDASYIAGLFDGEGSITYKKYKEKKGDYNKKRREWHRWKARAKKVGVEPLPARRPPPAQRKAGENEIETK